MTSLVLDPRTTALVLIDLQKGIVHQPLAPRSGPAVVANCARLADCLRGLGGLVVPVHVAFSADRADALAPPADASLHRPGAAPAPDYAEFVPEMAPKPGDVVITKHQWGAFYGTELDLQLRRRAIGTIVLAGIATNFGVESTARNAYELGYAQVFVEDAMTSRSAEGHAFCCQTILPLLGRVRSTEQVLAALGG
jgi:nicotinamidase-related amidase